MKPRTLLQLEGAAVLIVSLLFYHWNQGSWLQFALLFLLPDLSMLGYAGILGWERSRTMLYTPNLGPYCLLVTRSGRITLRSNRSP